jgi:hypothetical protein
MDDNLLNNDFYYDQNRVYRLVIENGEIIANEQYNRVDDRWEPSVRSESLMKLESAFYTGTGRYFYSHNSSMRVVLKDGAIHSYQIYGTYSRKWEDIKRFDYLGQMLILKRAFEDHNRYKQQKVISNLDIETIKKFYPHATADSSRFHFFSASSLKYEKLSGDALKTQILILLYIELGNCKNLIEFNNKMVEIKYREEYTILARGQGITTRALGLETSSIKAFKNMTYELSLAFAELDQSSLDSPNNAPGLG